MDKQFILSKLSSQRQQLKNFGVSRIGLFGSMVRGQATQTSDVDVLVEFEPGKKSFRNFMGTASLLEGLLDRSIDLVTPEALSSYLKPKIEKEVEYVQISN